MLLFFNKHKRISSLVKNRICNGMRTFHWYRAKSDSANSRSFFCVNILLHCSIAPLRLCETLVMMLSRSGMSTFQRFMKCRLVVLRSHSDAVAETVNLTWIRRDGSKVTTAAKLGSNLLRTAQHYDLEIEGACEGVCACSTCHCILEKKVYDSLPEPSETEEDMLDQAFGLTATSRLGCQVIITKDMEGITIKLPKATRNFYVDGHVPKPH